MDASGACVNVAPPVERPAAAAFRDKSEFCRRTPIGVCEPMPANFVLAATRDLCHSLLLQRKRSVVAEKAAKLAAQLRLWENPSELVVNHAEVRRRFDVRADVRLDLRPVADDEAAGYFKRSDAAEKWQNDFAAFVDGLTAGQALVFGPWFACSLLHLATCTVATVASNVCALAKKMPFAPAAAVVLLGEEVLVTLLQKYAGAQPDRVLVNTVAAGLIHACYEQILPPVSSAMIEDTCFHWLAFSGMELLSLLNSLGVMFPASFEKYATLVAEYADSSQIRLVEESHKAIENFHASSRVERMGLFWMYVKVFDDDPSTDISYSRHRWFCDLIVYVIDLLRTAVGVEAPEWSVEYRKFMETKSMFQIATFSPADVELAKRIVDQCLPALQMKM